MRILVVVKDFPTARNRFGGVFILRRLQALRDLGHEFKVLRIVPYAPPIGAKWNAYRTIPSTEVIEGIPVQTARAIIPPRLVGMEFVALQLHRCLQREIAKFRPQILHASYLVPCGQLAVRQSVPSIVTTHGRDGYAYPFVRPGLYRASQEALLKATRVTAVSDYLKQCVQSIVLRDVRVIWNGGDERFFYPRDARTSRERLGLPLDRFIVAYAGAMLRAKGLFDLVKAVSIIPADRRPIIAMAGTGPDMEMLRAEAQSGKVHLHFLGQLGQEDVAELFGAADVVTLPSYHEGLPNVVCEAMLSQRAVLATKVGGIPEVIEDSCSGALVAPGSPSELAARLEHLAGDPGQRERLAKAARAFATKHLTWRISAQKYSELFHEVLTETKSESLTSTSV